MSANPNSKYSTDSIYRLSFGQLIGEAKTKERAWWKRKEYKIPQDQLKIFKRPEKKLIQKYHSKFKYYNSSQFRHWILGAAILLLFLSLGCTHIRMDSGLSHWDHKTLQTPLRHVFGLLWFTWTSHQSCYKVVISRGVKLWQAVQLLPDEIRNDPNGGSTDTKEESRIALTQVLDIKNQKTDEVNEEKLEKFNVVIHHHDKLMEAVNVIDEIESCRFLLLCQHLTSLMLFLMALLVDYKGIVRFSYTFLV